tara:strand:+ start:197 stop:454 length:258 start_codon:yes stop_codon:yes gene_type:complete
MANKLEKDLLESLNKHEVVSEGLALGILKWIMKSKVKRALGKLAKDPEMKAAQRDYMYHAERLKKLVDKMGDSADPKLRKIANSI